LAIDAALVRQACHCLRQCPLNWVNVSGAAAVATVELNKENLESTILNNDIVLIDFWGPSCGPCQSFAPIYEQVSEKHPDVVFAKVNVEEEQEIAGHFQIQSIPTIMMFREQVIIFSESGMLPEEGLEEVIQKARDLDMDKVRADIEAQQESDANS
jgi:thioredoxin 1